MLTKKGYGKGVRFALSPDYTNCFSRLSQWCESVRMEPSIFFSVKGLAVQKRKLLVSYWQCASAIGNRIISSNQHLSWPNSDRFNSVFSTHLSPFKKTVFEQINMFLCELMTNKKGALQKFGFVWFFCLL